MARVDVHAAGKAVAIQTVAQAEHLTAVLLAVVGVRNKHLDVTKC